MYCSLWLAESFICWGGTGNESRDPGWLPEGCSTIGDNFVFSVEAVEYPTFDPDVDHAREGFDFVINTEEVQISFGSSSPVNIEVTFFPDDVALESSEIVKSLSY